MQATIAPPNPKTSNLARSLTLAYGVASYLVFFASFLYAVGFIGGFATPTMLDGFATVSLGKAILVNCSLLTLFALQHSIMARPAFKRVWTRLIPAAAERSTYVLASSIALIAVFAYWEPLGGTLWSIQGAGGQSLLYFGYALGWMVVLSSTFLINHFDLFGLRQVWLHFRGRPYTNVPFVTPWPYRVVRHPLYLGWLMVMWLTPHMTVSHFLFAALASGYIFIGIRLEERDLAQEHDSYISYRQHVPMIFPSLRSLRELSSSAPKQPLEVATNG